MMYPRYTRRRARFCILYNLLLTAWLVWRATEAHTFGGTLFFCSMGMLSVLTLNRWFKVKQRAQRHLDNLCECGDLS